MRRQVSVQFPDALLFQRTRLQVGIVAYVCDRKYGIEVTHARCGAGEHRADLRGLFRICEVQSELGVEVAVAPYLSPKTIGRQLELEQVIEPARGGMLKKTSHCELIAKL